MAAISDLGCIVCRNQGRGYVPAAVHHLLSGGVRIGHLHTIPLCDPGHHQNAPRASGEWSRHPDKSRFEAAYGTEEELLLQARLIVARGAGNLQPVRRDGLANFIEQTFIQQAA